MKFKLTNSPSKDLDKKIADGLSHYNSQYSSGDFEKLTVYCESDCGEVIGGLVGITYGKWLHVSELWVDEKFRRKSIGMNILSQAENEAARRGCIGVTLDTYSFQSLEFYLKCGYSEFGMLEGYAGKYKRHYLKKDLSNLKHNQSQQWTN